MPEGHNTEPISRPIPDQFPSIPEAVAGQDRFALQKAAFETQLAAWQEAVRAHTTREDTRKANEAAMRLAIQAAYIDTAKASLDRAVTRVNVFTAAIGSVITIYTTLLALVYTIGTKETNGKALDIVGFVPALFLSAALLLVSVYSVMLKKKMDAPSFIPTGIGGDVAEMRLVNYVNWCFSGILERRWALHAGLASFAIGILTLPIGFIGVSGLELFAIVVAGVLLVLAAGYASTSAVPTTAEQLKTTRAEAIAAAAATGARREQHSNVKQHR